MVDGTFKLIITYNGSFELEEITNKSKDNKNNQVNTQNQWGNVSIDCSINLEVKEVSIHNNLSIEDEPNSNIILSYTSQDSIEIENRCNGI